MLEKMNTTGILVSVLVSLKDLVSNRVLIFLFLLFLLLGHNQLLLKTQKLFSPQVSKKSSNVFKSIQKQVQTYLVIKTILSLITSILMLIVLLLFALIAWGYLWGFIGMLLAVPLTVLLKIIFENIESLSPVAKLMTIQKDE